MEEEAFFIFIFILFLFLDIPEVWRDAEVRLALVDEDVVVKLNHIHLLARVYGMRTQM